MALREHHNAAVALSDPNLSRIPGGDDDLARVVLARLPGQIGPADVATVDDRTRLAIGRYGTRAVTLALRESSQSRLQEGLLATAVAELADPEDPRDFMVGLALPYAVGRDLGLDPASVFEQVAQRLDGTAVAEALRTFAVRQDVTLAGFGWKSVTTTEGPDFILA
jgi:hypothetical protein